MSDRALNRLSNPRVVVVASAMVILAVGLGVMAGFFGLLAVVGLATLAAVVAVLYRPFFGLLVLVATIPVENAVAVSGDLTSAKLVGIAVFAGWFVGKVIRRESWRHIVSTLFFATAVLFVLIVLASTLWARAPLVARSGFVSMSQMVVLAVIILDLVDSRERLDTLIKVLLVSAAVAAALTVYQSEVVGLRRAGGDVAGGINSTAVLLVSTVPLGFYMLRGRFHPAWRLFGLIYIPLAVLGVLVTFSRFNLLLMPLIVAAFAVLTLRERRSRSWLLGLFAVSAVAALLFVPWEKLQKRTETIAPYLAQTLQFGEEREATSPRGYHLRIGLAILRDHPILGVGYGNYGFYFTEVYQFQIPGADKVYRSWRSPHSSFIGIAADLGIVGLVIWVSLLLVSVRAVWHAWLLSRSSGDEALAALVQALAAMLALQVIAYGWYMPQQREKFFWLVLALCAAVWRILSLQQPQAVGEMEHSETDDQTRSRLEEPPLTIGVR